jgi:hypothetical protein
MPPCFVLARPQNKPSTDSRPHLAVAPGGRHVCQLHVPVVLRLVQLPPVDFSALQLNLQGCGSGVRGVSNGRGGAWRGGRRRAGGGGGVALWASPLRPVPRPSLDFPAILTVHTWPVASCSNLTGTPTPLREPAAGGGCGSACHDIACQRDAAAPAGVANPHAEQPAPALQAARAHQPLPSPWWPLFLALSSQRALV